MKHEVRAGQVLQFAQMPKVQSCGGQATANLLEGWLMIHGTWEHSICILTGTHLLNGIHQHFTCDRSKPNVTLSDVLQSPENSCNLSHLWHFALSSSCCIGPQHVLMCAHLPQLGCQPSCGVSAGSENPYVVSSCRAIFEALVIIVSIHFQGREPFPIS